jgi:hypothetical protein
MAGACRRHRLLGDPRRCERAEARGLRGRHTRGCCHQHFHRGCRGPELGRIGNAREPEIRISRRHRTVARRARCDAQQEPPRRPGGLLSAGQVAYQSAEHHELGDLNQHIRCSFCRRSTATAGRRRRTCLGAGERLERRRSVPDNHLTPPSDRPQLDPGRARACADHHRILDRNLSLIATRCSHRCNGCFVHRHAVGFIIIAPLNQL